MPLHCSTPVEPTPPTRRSLRAGRSDTPSIASRRLRRPSALAVCAGVVAGIAVTAGAVLGSPVSAPAAAAALVTAVPLAGPLSPSTSAAGVAGVALGSAEARATIDHAEASLGRASTLAKEIAASGLDLGADATVDTSSLSAASDRLASSGIVPVLLFPELADDARAETKAVDARVSELRARLSAARVQKAADEAAAEAQRQAEAAAAAEAQRQAEELAARNTPDGARALAQGMAAERYGWGADQFSCLASLWTKESGWDYQAYNASSGATGIPQALPGDKMASAGADWATDAGTQIAWGLDYISRAYGSPCSAWGHSQATDWY
jgi:hypothetical protein